MKQTETNEFVAQGAATWQEREEHDRIMKALATSAVLLILIFTSTATVTTGRPSRCPRRKLWLLPSADAMMKLCI